MADLMLQRKDVQLVINFPINRSFKDFEKDLSSIGMLYAYIIHDKDTNELGEYKTRHIHLVLSSLKRHQLKYYIRFIAESLDIKEMQISIQPCDSLAFAIQYLIHKNDRDKYQYNITSIRSNFNEGTLSDYLNEDIGQKLTTNDIIKLIIESKGDKIRIIEVLGLSRYVLYRNAINDIYSSLGYRIDSYKYNINEYSNYK